MNQTERLVVRGWREVEVGMWCPGDLVGHSAMNATLPLDKAVEALQRCDADDVRLNSSVTYRPTREQAHTSASLAGMAARGMCERDVIEHLHRELQRLQAGVLWAGITTAGPRRGDQNNKTPAGTFWTARAVLTTIGQGSVELSMDEAKVRVAIPVTLPSDEQTLAALLYQPVVLSIAPAPAEGKAFDEDLAWHRAEVLRLRGLLSDIEKAGTTGARFEVGTNRLCILAPTEGAEQALLTGFTSWLAGRDIYNPEVAKRVEKAERLAYHAGALAAINCMALYLPSQGKRLGPAPCEALKKLVADNELAKWCDTSMRRYLDEHEAELAEATFGIDAKEWGRADAEDKKGGDSPKSGRTEITQAEFDEWLNTMRQDMGDEGKSSAWRAGVAYAVRALVGDESTKDGAPR